MEDRLYFLASEIHDSLNNHPLVISLNELESRLNDSYEVYQLSNKKNETLEVYLNNKKIYGEDNEITKKSLINLKEAKEKLNNHPLVKEYLKIYSQVRDLYLQINDIVLGDK